MFADNTTPPGEKEIDSGVQKTKEVLNEFEERTNDDEEEWLEFGSNEAEEIRMLGCWVGANADVKNRKKRANGLWAQVRSELSKKQQAKIVVAYMESGILFDAATRS